MPAAAVSMTRLAWRRRVARLSRWLHIYGSMGSLALVLFFAITGMTLNHQDWFAGQQVTFERHGTMSTSWLRSAAAEGVDKLEVVRSRIPGPSFDGDAEWPEAAVCMQNGPFQDPRSSQPRLLTARKSRKKPFAFVARRVDAIRSAGWHGSIFRSCMQKFPMLLSARIWNGVVLPAGGLPSC